MNRARGTLFGTELLLWGIAVVCLGWAGWAWSDARWYQTVQGERLAARSAATAGGETVGRPRVGAPLARLSVPRLDLSVVVAEGTGEGVLRRAVGRLTTSALPGTDGNVVLAGHRDTFLRPLEGIGVGDEIRVERGGEVDVYRVEWTRVVDPEAVEVTHDAGEPALTLVTCYPFRYVGPAPRRFVVRALLTERIR